MNFAKFWQLATLHWQSVLRKTLHLEINLLFTVRKTKTFTLIRKLFCEINLQCNVAKNTLILLIFLKKMWQLNHEISTLYSVHLGVISFWLIGFGIAFGEGSPYIGLTNFAGYGLSFRNHAMLFFQVSTYTKCRKLRNGNSFSIEKCIIFWWKM